MPMFVLVRAFTYASAFIGLLVVLLPAELPSLGSFSTVFRREVGVGPRAFREAAP
jgi:AraC-like DNA-binding protein